LPWIGWRTALSWPAGRRCWYARRRLSRPSTFGGTAASSA